MKHTAQTILIIDDEPTLRKLLSRLIGLEGYNVLAAGSLDEARKILSREMIPVILCDVRLPDGNGVDFTKEAIAKYPDVQIILMTAYGDIQDGVQAMKNGAFDYIVKADDNGKIIPLLAQATEKVTMRMRLREMDSALPKSKGFDSIIGVSQGIANAKSLARKVANTNTTVLLLGETGSGKEVFAAGIHQESDRSGKPFVALNCGAVPHDLLESELFGYKAGAFTNALKDKKGLMEQANGGTLFLDEIGEMPPDLQTKLLRVLETSDFLKLGDVTPTKVDVRIIAATNRDIENEAMEGKFRRDLLYRLNVFTIELPPLNERRKDIPLLAKHFIELFAAKNKRQAHTMSAGFLEALENHNWKGNIRELKNILERAMILAETAELTVEHLPLDFVSADANSNHPSSRFDLAKMESIQIRRALEYTRNNKTEAARLLNIGLATLYRKIEEYKISLK
ncbi:MAG: sigma-54-dependent transcriptional regulator [Agriterribacter sp.]